MLARGARLGSYEVLEPLGTGGMGEVFRARDSRLGREVAIKVLSDHFKLDSQHLMRFEREARVLGSLNHPNIAMLHAVEPLGDTQALVLELVEGETLSERIARGPMPLPEAVAIARQIAAALEAAHEQGVVHRDLKPSNIKLRPDGAVKLLDFGIAKVRAPLFAQTDLHAATVTLVDGGPAIVGTPAYMSPEQARGLPVDKRTDIWAFGCVLYEMLTGEAAFQGESAPDVVAKIIEREPDLEALPREASLAIRQLLQRCLRKDPRERLRDIGDARLELEEAGATGEVSAATDRGRMDWRKAAVLVLALAGIVVAADAVLRLRARPTTEPAQPRVSRFSVPTPFILSGSRSLAISPDGARIVYMSDRGLFMRSRDRLEFTELAVRASSVSAPFFSPDGQWIGYNDTQALLKVPADGGSAAEIVESGPAAVASWSTAGIVFASMHGLFRVSPDGGRAQRLEAGVGPNEQAMFPQFLPGNETVLFTVIPTRSNMPPGDIASSPGARVDVLDLASGARRTLLRGGGRAQYVPTGHLVYVAGDTLYAVAFDAGRLELRGEPVPMVASVRSSEFAVADDGTLVYWGGGSVPHNTLVWVDRQGREEPLEAPPRRYLYPRISPDGTRVALDVQGPPNRDVWIWDLRRRTLERFTDDPAGNPLVAWSRDGRHLAFGSERRDGAKQFLQAADGSGEPEPLLESDLLQQPLTFAPDGRLLFSMEVAGRGRDVHALSMDGSRRVEPILYSVANDLNAEVSPDGRWIVFDSDESGQYEIYVRPYPHAYSGGHWQISSGGGRHPMWSHDGREIYYRDFDGDMWAASVELSPTFAPGPAVRLFANRGYSGGGRPMSGRAHDLSPDGRRFLMIKRQPDPAASAPAIVVVLNWFEELKRAVPASGPAAAR